MITLREVAKEAGVTPMTVSRVINSPSKVKEETRIRVERAMKDLNYVPNVSARNLATNKTHIINVYIHESIDWEDPFLMHFITGVSKALSKHYYSFLIVRNLEKTPKCDGYIVTGLMKDELKSFKELAIKQEKEFVLFGHTDDKDVDYIDVDNALGAYKIVKYLIDNGHQRIAMINADLNKDYPVDRYEGYRKALEYSTLAYDDKLIVYADNSVNGGLEAMRKLLKRNDFTAVFCATDTIAIGANMAINEIGKKVPQDISVVGFDGLGHQLLSVPNLTTIRQPIERVGEMLADELVAKINRKEGIKERYIEPELLVGKSVKKIK